MKDLSNQVFGHLMAIKPTKQRKWGSVVWQCKCLYCGNEQVYKDAGNLQKPHDHNCGCHISQKSLQNLKKGHTIIDLTGQIFGDFKVLYLSKNNEKYKPIKWHCKCIKCGFEKDINSQSLREQKSKYCKCHRSSKGQDKIQKILLENNFSFEKEKIFNTCKGTKFCLPFDFYVNNQYLIEYDGIQHFQESIFDYEYTHAHDIIKSQWCKENHIPLIRIPYTHFDILCLEDLLLETTKFLEN